MNLGKALYCRGFQMALRAALPLLPYRQPQIIHSCPRLGLLLEDQKIQSVLIVTDAGIVSHGLLAPVQEALQKSRIPYTIYDKTQANPTVANVEEALVQYQQQNCQALIAMGGGSAMDCAKAVGARVAYPNKSVGQMKGILRVLRSLPLLIAIPTTAGTGSETTLASVITDSETHHKYALMSFPLIPHYAVLDPCLTYSLPPQVTATTGMDALTHAVEVYIGKSTTKETRQLAMEATRLVFANLEIAYRDGTNHTARENMLLAAYQAGAAFSKSYVGYIHAIAHSLSGRYGTPHGLANAVMMPYVLDTYGECVYEKLHQLGIYAGVCSEEDSPQAGAKAFIAAIRTLNHKMRIPDTIQGIATKDIPAMANHAEREANPLYPVPRLMTKTELERLYYKVAAGSQETHRDQRRHA